MREIQGRGMGWSRHKLATSTGFKGRLTLERLRRCLKIYREWPISMPTSSMATNVPLSSSMPPGRLPTTTEARMRMDARPKPIVCKNSIAHIHDFPRFSGWGASVVPGSVPCMAVISTSCPFSSPLVSLADRLITMPSSSARVGIAAATCASALGCSSPSCGTESAR